MKHLHHKSTRISAFLALLGFLALLNACNHGAVDGGNSYHYSPESQEMVAVDEPIGPEFNTEAYNPIVENEFMDPDQTPYSTFSIDVDAASYANMRRFINQGELPPPDAIRSEELVNYFTYNYAQPQDHHPFNIYTELAECPWNPQRQLVHIGLQGKEIPTDALPPSNLVFLIDVSGSMQAENKLPLLKQSFQLLVEQLRPEDRVALVVYAGAAGVVLNSTSGDRKMRILSALDHLEAGGSTAGGEGIELAYLVAEENFVEDGNNRIILATDGDFNVGPSSDGALERMIVEKRESGVFLTVLGFGMGNYKDSKMQTLADKGNGNHAYIDNILEARKVLVNEFGGTLFTIAKDVKIQVEFNPAAVKGYRLIGYENRLLADEDFNDDRKDAGELGSGHTVTALYEVIPADSEEEIREVDATRYQRPDKETVRANKSGELLHVKFRYKLPAGEESHLMDRVVYAEARPANSTTEDFRWSAAVTEFSLLLRDSKFKGAASFDHVIEVASEAIGEDPEGYRAEFIGLVKRAKALHHAQSIAEQH